MVVIAGERSGVGKTTVTLALLASLRRRSLSVQSFKVGPDYIDPMFHQYVTGRPCRNLDPALTSNTYVQQCFARHIQGVDYALVEGVMGLFDGAGSTDQASTAHVARLLQLPVVLVIDCSRLSRSVAAIVHGYRSFDPQVHLAGVVLNRVSSNRHLELLQAALAPLHVPILGIIRRQDNITIPSRHLGLIPTAELPQLNTLIDQLAHLGDTCFNWQHLLPLLKTPPAPSAPRQLLHLGEPQDRTGSPAPPAPPALLRLAIARDSAFSFYYQDNLDLLQSLGAELVFWSPLTDETLPENIHGLYFGGGFPEVFAQQLTENAAARKTVQQLIQAGIPTYAECGGLMYLCQQIVDFAGQSWSMVGAIPTTSVMDSHLTLGYRQATALQDSPMVRAGTVVWGHEFHRSRLSTLPIHPLFQIQKDNSRPATLEGWGGQQLHASYIHLHFGGQPEIPSRFLQHCAQRRD